MQPIILTLLFIMKLRFIIIGVRRPIFCILLRDDILKCMYINVAGASVTTYNSYKNKNLIRYQFFIDVFR